VKDAQINSVALFFFYTFLDKSLALKATIEAIDLFNKKQRKDQTARPVEALLVQATFKIWKKYSKKRNIKIKELDLFSEGWIVPTNLKLEPWRDFVKEADPDLYLVVIWSKLLSFGDRNISLGLGISEGSVRYRAGRGLKELGQILPHAGGLDA
jgi:DNA-directed RNA polymerase specialized sigma24 family protein